MQLSVTSTRSVFASVPPLSCRVSKPPRDLLLGRKMSSAQVAQRLLAPAGPVKAASTFPTANDLQKGMSVHAQSDVPDAALTLIKPSVAPLFTPIKLGRYELQCRMAYPPLTRLRASPDHVPQPIMAQYYSQRATPGGLMISEGTYINNRASGYPCASGVYTQEQVEAWKPIVAAVQGAVFFNQIWHCGRASHPDLIYGQTPVAPSPIAVSGEIFIGDGKNEPYPVPEALDHAGIKAVIADYATAARNAIAAGFDGVEIHGANGYLIEQFIKSSSNTRTDEYGGSIENRCRFALEVVAAVVAAVGADRVGLRLSPFTGILDCTDDTPYTTYMYLVEQLNKHYEDLAYIHMIEARIQGVLEVEHKVESLEPFRKVWQGAFIVAGGYKADVPRQPWRPATRIWSRLAGCGYPTLTCPNAFSCLPTEQI